MSSRLGRPRSLLHWNTERFPLAGWCCVGFMRWVQLCGVHEPHQATRDKRKQPCPSPVQRQHFPGGCGAPRVTFQSQYWIFCSSSQLPNFCFPRWQGFLCLIVGNLQSLWRGQGWAACRQLSLQGGLPLASIWNSILLPAPTPRPACTVQVFRVPHVALTSWMGHRSSQGGHSAIIETVPFRVWAAFLSGFPFLWVKYHLKCISLNYPDGWGITRGVGFCGFCFLAGCSLWEWSLSSLRFPALTSRTVPGVPVRLQEQGKQGIFSRVWIGTRAGNALGCSLGLLTPFPLPNLTQYFLSPFSLL